MKPSNVFWETENPRIQKLELISIQLKEVKSRMSVGGRSGIKNVLLITYCIRLKANIHAYIPKFLKRLI